MSTRANITLSLALVLLLGLFVTPVLGRRGHFTKGAGKSAGFSYHDKYSQNRSGFRVHVGLNHRPYFGRHEGLPYRPHIDRHLRVPNEPHSDRQPRFHHRPHFGRRRRFNRGLRFTHLGRHHFFYFSLPYRRYYYLFPPYYYDSYDRDDYDAPDEKPYDTPYDEQGEYEQKEAEKPADVDEINRHLDYIADVFAVGEYTKAALRARRAVKAEPDSAVLRFVYSQTLFADEEYKRAAVVLRQALEKTDLEKEGVFFAISFYPDESVLTGQIDTLIDAAQSEPSRADLQLLLGYQLLGLSRFDEALDAFQKAKQDYVNRKAAVMLIDVLEKTRKAGEIDTPLQEQSNEPQQAD